MKIKQFKRNKDESYTLCLENGETYVVYQEVILKYHLLFSKEIDDETFARIEQENAWWNTYYYALKLLKEKARSIKEINEVLLKKGYMEKRIEEVIQTLEKQHYLDDEKYADSYLTHQVHATSYGPDKIKKLLLEKGISLEIAEEKVEYYSKEMEEEKVEKRIQKMIKSNHTKSTRLLKQKIKDTLLRDGFSLDIIEEKLKDASFLEDDHLQKREYEKIKKHLMKKYKGEELERQIKRKLYQKGFTD